MKIAIVLGGGDGTRAGGPVPKQFQLLDHVPVLLRSVKAMAAGGAERIYVVLHPEFLREWEERLENEPYAAVAVCGGKSRWHSVANALISIREDGYSADDLVAVHDGARPLVPAGLTLQGWECAAENGTAVPAVPVTDSLRRITAEGSEAVDRSKYRAVQTPQIFRADILLKAYSLPYDPRFTDDASVVQADGGSIHLFPGSPLNIKITNPADMAVAEVLLKETVHAPH